MNPKVKNIILFASIALVLIVVYTLLIRKEEEPNVSSSNSALPSASSTTPGVANVSGVDPQTANEILTLLLSVRNITLDETVFNDAAFISLEDSTVPLDQDGTEGRPNPFAPIGVDAALTNSSTLPQSSNTPLNNIPVQVPAENTTTQSSASTSPTISSTPSSTTTSSTSAPSSSQ